MINLSASDKRINTQIGKRSKDKISTTGQRGFLIYGPYIPLNVGDYTLEIEGEIVSNLSCSGVWVDLAFSQGTLMRENFFIGDIKKIGCICSLPFTLSKTCTDLEVRVFVDTSVDMSIFKIKIFQSQSENDEKFLFKKKEFNTLFLPETERRLVQKEVSITDILAYRKKLLTSSDVLACALAEKIIKDPFQIKKQDLNNLLDTVLILKQYRKLTRDKILSIFDKITSESITNSIEDINIENTKPYKQPIIISGFHSSGSSALFDFFRGHKECYDLFPATFFPNNGERELAIIRFIYFFIKQEGFLLRKSLVTFFINTILCLFIPLSNNELGCKTFGSIFSGFEKKPLLLDQYIAVVGEFFESLFTSKILINRQKFSLKFITNLSKIIDSKTTGHPVLNQAPNAMDLSPMMVYPLGAISVAVFRDPRDQYISLCTAGHYEFGKYDDILGFINNYTINMKKFTQQRSELDCDYNIYLIQYEKFILDPKERESLCKNLNMSYEENTPYFFPEQSATRIGKYKSLPEHQEAYNLIEDALPEYLWQGIC